MMAHTLGRIGVSAARFFLAQGHAFAYYCFQQHPPRLSTMRTRGVTFFSSSDALKLTETPAMPLHDAHFGGFFMPTVWAIDASVGVRR